MIEIRIDNDYCREFYVVADKDIDVSRIAKAIMDSINEQKGDKNV